MIGKIINYGTDKLLPEEYRYLGDYTCAVIDAAQGDYASAAVCAMEGISQNLNQAGCEEGAVAAEIAGQAAGAARGDINSALTENMKGNTALNMGVKMGAIGISAGGGAIIDGKNGAKTGSTLAQGSIGKTAEDTVFKGCLTMGGAIGGRQIKNNTNGLIQGANLSQHSVILISDSKDIIESNSNQSNIKSEDLKRIKDDAINVYRDQKQIREDDPKTKTQVRKATKDNLKLDILDSSSDMVAITSNKIIEEDLNKDSVSEHSIDKFIDIATEIGKTANSVCRLRETRVEIEEKTYKITDTLCYTGSNIKEIRNEFEEKNKNFKDYK